MRWAHNNLLIEHHRQIITLNQILNNEMGSQQLT